MASPVDKEFSSASNSFAAELYQKTIEGKTGNVIISPVSIQTAVTLAFFGASGKTAEEMKTSLKYPAGYSNENIAKNYQGLSESFSQTNGLKIANKVFVKEGYSIKPKFNEVATKSFNSEAQQLDFNKSVESAKTINDWVEGHTNNKIKDLIKSDTLDDDTRMVLVNAIYFKGFWRDQFDPQATFKGDFFLNDKDVVTVDYMKIKKYFKYGALPDYDATAIELPYKDSDITMMIILPNSKTGLSALEAKLHQINLPEVSNSLYSQEVNVEIPKFKIEFDIELNEPLQKMGMNRMFENSAEFNELLESTEPLKVSKVVHKAFIEVNEEGAEAAAATGMGFATFCMIMEDINFNVNQPFLFALINTETDVILFNGRVNNPSA
ncbi:unnamed protein product [Diamesa tonsa]